MKGLIVWSCIVSSLWAFRLRGEGQEPTYIRRTGSVSRQNLLKNARFLWHDDRFSFRPLTDEPAEPDMLRVLAIRVEFQTDGDDRTTGDGRFDLSTSAEPIIDAPPHDRDYFTYQLDALGNYYRTVSNERLIIQPTVTDEIFTLPFVMAHYNPGTTEELVDQGLAELFRDAVLLADAAGIRFSDYDCFLVFHAGVGRDIDLGFDPSPSDIPSAFLNIDDLRQHLAEGDPGYPGIPVEDGSYHISEGIILPETESQEGYEIGLLGTMTLMFGFQIGLPALWNTVSGRSGIGSWGLMDQGSGNYLGLIPAEPCAWTKVFMGWETPIDTLMGSNLDVACPKASNLARIYRIPINDHEYFLIENRIYDPNGDGVTLGWDESGNPVTFTPDGRLEALQPFRVIVRVDEYDYGLPGSGILIWHVDEEVIRENIAINRVNADRNHRGVDLEEADGAQDIGELYDFVGAGAGSETGVLHDAWYEDNEIHLLANGSETVRFGPDTHPSSRSYTGANSHIVISEFSGIDTVMSFTVTNDLLQAGFPQAFGQGNLPFPILYGDLDGDGYPEIVVGTEGGKIFAWKREGGALVPGDATGFRVSVSGDTLVFTVALFIDAGEAMTVPPVVADIDDNGRDDIVAASTSGTLWSWTYQDGTVQTILNWDAGQENITALSFIHGMLILGMESSALTALSPDGETLWSSNLQTGEIAGICQHLTDELIVTTSTGRVAAVDENGNILWTQVPAGEDGIMPPVAAWDPTDTESSITMVADGGTGVILNASGDESARFNIDTLSGDYTEPVPADLDEDGFWEVVLTAQGKVWCYNHNGTLADYFPFPYQERETVLSSPVLGDVDGDGRVDVLFASSSGDVEAYRYDGVVIDGFPLTTGSVVSLPPALLDLDGDGDIEVAAVSERGFLYVWDLPGAYAVERVPWGSYRHDPAHTGALEQALQTQPPASDLMPSNLVYNYPNPTQGNRTTIRYRLEQSADVLIRVFDLAGELVDEFPGPGEPQTENEAVWDLTDVESGVYFCQVRATGDGGEKVVTFKIGVVK